MLPREVPWFCEGKLNLGSSCILGAITDFLNLVFVDVFFLSLLIHCVTKGNHIHGGSSRRDRVSVVVSICCTLVGIVYISVGLWEIADEATEFNWLAYLGRGLVWFCLAVSLLVRKSKWTRNLVTVWWLCFCLLVSAIDIESLARMSSISVPDLVSWPVNFLLLVCGFRNFSALDSLQSSNQKISEPLLGEKNETKSSRIGQVGFLSKLTFCWMNPLLSLGYVKPLSPEDIPTLPPGDEANVVYHKFALEFDSLVKKKSTDSNSNLLLKTVTKVHFKENISVAVYAFLKLFATVASPVFLYAFVNYSNVEEQNLQQGFYIVGGLIIAKMVESLCQRHWYFESRRSGMKIRSALMVAIYQKQLKLSCIGRRRHSTGEIVNYIAVDAYRMGEFPWWLHTTWSLSLQLLLSVTVLLKIVGHGALVGLVPLFIFGILNLPFARMIQKCQSKLMIAQDERLRATSEILNSMRIIKLQSWEEKFKTLIETHRDEEFKWLKEMQIRKAFSSLLYWMSPTIVSSVIFLTCAFLNSAPLNASTIFTVLATLRNMGEPVRMIPEGLSAIIQGMVSFKRINTFLLDDELKNDDGGRFPHQNTGESVTIRGGAFSWDPDLSLPTLRDLNLDIKSGQKTAVCGVVGAGKSSLLYAILGEMPKISGTIGVSGSIAYVSQTSWIQSGTIRDNILYGKPMEQTRYDLAVKVCALDKDMDSFPRGDLTEIGQRGLNMSGGQKQRIQLARAVYNDADIYLLDDPFSAVDAHTAAFLFNECVMNALAKKTVILVTHQVEFLSAVDRILVVADGRITQSGDYKELLMAGTTFEQLVNAHKDAIPVLGPADKENNGEPERVHMVRAEESLASYPVEQQIQDEIQAIGETGLRLTQEEEKEIGDVGLKPLIDYLNVSKQTLLLFVGIVFQICFVAFSVASTCWLAFSIRIPEISNGALVGVYSLISVFGAVFVYGRSLVVAHLGLKASNSFYHNLTNSIFKAPMFFFDSTPVGRILTRASSDLSVVDFDIPFSLVFVMTATVELVVIIGIMVSVTWKVIIVASIAMAATKYVQGYYIASARELIRINGTTKAPVVNSASETSLGVVTIRAFKMADRFFQNYVKLVDQDAVLFFHSNGALEWLLMRVEALQNVTLFAAAIFLVLLPKGYISPGMVGLSLSYALTLTMTQVFLTRWYCNLSNQLISVERIVQFMHIPEEPPAVMGGKRPPSSWPFNGRIELQDLKIRYRPNAPLVLKGINCTIKERTRVGVVGRTGSGKTTLISALFRLVEADSGKILIDGLDIGTVGLKELRTKLSIIPQEPTLFRGSVRTNLDPLGRHSDEELWEALEKCQLKATISSLPKGLDSSVSDDGENWSAGQRQLFCLGRVVLRKNRILVLDEATASIDSATDAILQNIIRQEFSECTVVTVAHRVPTVIDSDMVMVLSYGKLVEYGQPPKLIHANSFFAKLVAEYWSSCRRNSN